MLRSNGINLLLSGFDTEAEALKQKHDACLDTGKPDRDFIVGLSDHLQHCKQVLDFIADSVRSSYSAPRGLYYYPIASLDKSRTFVEQLLERSWWKGLRQANPAVFDYYLENQHYKVGSWLAEFKEVANANKHSDFASHEQIQEIQIGDHMKIRSSPFMSINNCSFGGVNLDMVVGPDQQIRMSKDPAQLEKEGLIVRVEKWFELSPSSQRMPALEFANNIRGYVLDAYNSIDLMIE